LLAIACVGWFGVQSAVCGMSFSAMFATIFNVQIPVWLSILFWGVIMLITASFGFKGLKLLNTVAVPLLVIVCLYGLILAIARNDGLSLIAVYQPAVNMAWFSASITPSPPLRWAASSRAITAGSRKAARMSSRARSSGSSPPASPHDDWRHPDHRHAASMTFPPCLSPSVRSPSAS
jgi:hypothetical protein